jgi:hypothetical protein
VTTDLGFPRVREVEPDFPRDHLEFVDPADDSQVIRADLTWLLSSWTCIFGNGCHGVIEGQAEQGCCAHGAYFSEPEDEERVDAFVSRLTKEHWEHADLGRKGAWAIDDELDGEPARKTAVVDGACIFHNRADFPGGGGCSLHGLALREGLHPLETKPDVCWQLPIRRSQEVVERADEVTVTVTSIGEFDRRGWGPGGEDLHWWCTSSPEAHIGADPVVITYGPELVALIGQPAYDELVRLCATRTGLPLHPATAAAQGS